MKHRAMQAMGAAGRRAKRFFRRLHRDESAPNTVEWMLLLIVALIVLVGIYMMISWVADRTEAEAKAMDEKKPTI